jgi:hypothetical protein
MGEANQPNKRIALDSADLHNSTMTFSAVPKTEVFSALQAAQPSSASFSTVRFVTPSTFIKSNDLSASNETRRVAQPTIDMILFHSVQTSGSQQVLLQQRGNLVIGQPLVTVTTD